MKTASALMLGALLLAGCASYGPAPQAAVAELKPTQGNQVWGTVTFTPKGEQLVMEARVRGLTPGLHGFHVHEKGDCSAPDGTSTGGHFNPHGKKHGNHGDSEHHAGDFGNLNADASGNATLQLTLVAGQLSLDKNAANSVVGRGLIVHADPDDHKTQPTGNSGKRVACGVVALK